ncbi:LacI family transcriptional regulator [Paenibacillus mesophilus]|uniref:LacI family DNA-binding transcriptional regulator n=1 Tax=Paenibacillus mesophilus TaxID=2582849 RepID=UPI00110E9385|nr:LacI family DNA-binding transcriptional regulator [Paenibacillus mesophilus]TMV49134.1 LacI family transcriptional regulator [Paenibacillus mesophilus]
MATIRDVAKLAGVSVATVSRVLNKTGYVNQETKEKVQQAIRMLHYEPNAMAKGLASRKTETLALILPDIANPFFAELGRAVEDVAQTYGYTVVLCNSDNDTDKEQKYIQILKSRYVDGILFASHTLRTADVVELNKSGIPLVVLDRAPANVPCLVVRSKNNEGAKMAVRHLHDIGCRKIGHLYGPQETATAKERLVGYEEAVRQFPWYSPTLLEPGNFSIRGGMEAAERLLARHPDIDGIFAGNDLMALGALKKMQQMGISVPGQLALVGFDGIDLTVVTEPEITTVAQPIYELGALATRLLIKKIEGVTIDNETYECDVTLMPRGTTQRAGAAAGAPGSGTHPAALPE